MVWALHRSSCRARCPVRAALRRFCVKRNTLKPDRGSLPDAKPAAYGAHLMLMHLISPLRLAPMHIRVVKWRVSISMFFFRDTLGWAFPPEGIEAAYEDEEGGDACDVKWFSSAECICL